jgi:hypothetical protein
MMVMQVLDGLAARASGWADLYGGSGTISLSVTYAHVAAMLVGGGLALASDRALLRTSVNDSGRVRMVLDEQRAVHRIVVSALCVSFVTGAAMFLADVEALGTNRVFWAKLGLVALLLVNGWLMLRAERTAVLIASTSALVRLRRHAVASAVLWLLTALAGTGLLQS